MHHLGIGTPDDIAAAALYPMHDESRYMIGALMLVDVGVTATMITKEVCMHPFPHGLPRGIDGSQLGESIG